MTVASRLRATISAVERPPSETSPDWILTVGPLTAPDGDVLEEDGELSVPCETEDDGHSVLLRLTSSTVVTPTHRMHSAPSTATSAISTPFLRGGCGWLFCGFCGACHVGGV